MKFAFLESCLENARENAKESLFRVSILHPRARSQPDPITIHASIRPYWLRVTIITSGERAVWRWGGDGVRDVPFFPSKVTLAERRAPLLLLPPLLLLLASQCSVITPPKDSHGGVGCSPPPPPACCFVRALVVPRGRGGGLPRTPGKTGGGSWRVR